MDKDAKYIKKKYKENTMMMDEGELVHSRKRRAVDSCDDEE